MEVPSLRRISGLGSAEHTGMAMRTMRMAAFSFTAPSWNGYGRRPALVTGTGTGASPGGPPGSGRSLPRSGCLKRLCPFRPCRVLKSLTQMGQCSATAPSATSVSFISFLLAGRAPAYTPRPLVGRGWCDALHLEQSVDGHRVVEGIGLRHHGPKARAQVDSRVAVAARRGTGNGGPGPVPTP